MRNVGEKKQKSHSLKSCYDTFSRVRFRFSQFFRIYSRPTRIITDFADHRADSKVKDRESPSSLPTRSSRSSHSIVFDASK